ncbi:MAG: hypothetical protein EOO16_04930 [Chitinophagaceae bacterium]|nr:MAG: hypothetical protein EOO16_04930 [Chitinophagaceae bacterium]
MLQKISLYRLRIAEAIRYLTQLVALIDAAGGRPPAALSDAVAALRARLGDLNALYQSDPQAQQAEALLETDEERDRLVVGLYTFCNAFTYLKDPALRDAGKLLVNTIEVYGTGSDIANQGNAAETTQVESLLADLRKPAQAAAVALLRAELFTTPLEAANTRYESLFLARNDENALRQAAGKMTERRKAAATAFDAVLRKLSGAYEMEGAGAWGDLVNKLNALSEEYRHLLAVRAGRAAAAEAPTAEA